MHLTSSPIDWYAARAGGVAAYVLLTLNVSIGLLMTGKKTMKHWPRFALEDVHRFTGILTGTFFRGRSSPDGTASPPRAL